MAEGDALHNGQGSTWHLLLQFMLDGAAGIEHRAVVRVTAAVQELGLQPAEVQRIGQAVMEVLRKDMQRQDRDQSSSPVLIRVWISGASMKDPARSGPDAEGVGRQMHRGWGFFLLERQEGALQDTEVEAQRVIELYLYQERRWEQTKAGMKGRT